MSIDVLKHLRPWLPYPVPVEGGRIRNEHVEINVAEHCNLSCRSCSHLSPAMPARFADPEQVYRDLHALASVYMADQVSLLGGEPLLHPDLPAVVEAARASGVAKQIRLVTNGVLLPRMAEHCWALVDEIRVSMYPGHELTETQLEACRRLAVAHDVTLRIRTIREFFESYSALGTHDEALVRRIYQTCLVAHAWRCHLVADGFFYKCPHAYFLARTLNLPSAAADGIELAGDDLQGRLRAYLRSAVPLQGCGHCLGTVGRRFEHQQVPRGEWSRPQQQPTEALVDVRLLRTSARYL